MADSPARARLEQRLVPDTLDLAERARAGVNVLTEVVAHTRDHQPYHCAWYYRSPQVFSINPGDHVFVTGDEMWGKHVEALVEMRLMSGSQQGADLDEKSLAGLIGCVEADNLFYSIVKRVQGRQLVPAEDFSGLASQARVMLGLIARYQVDGNPEWLEWLGRLARGLREVAIQQEDYAYYPASDVGGSLSRPRSGWKTSAEPIGVRDPYQWPENSSNVIFSYGGVVQALTRWYLVSGEPESLRRAGQLVRFMLKARFWRPEAQPRGVIGAEHAHFQGHIHAYVRGLWGLLEYAIATNDERLKAFARDGYDYVRTFGIARIGLFGEGCTAGDMASLAIKLTDAGVGDYWEDVDQYVRNHLTELQVLDEGPVRALAASSSATEVMPWEDPDRFAARQIGFICGDATHPTVATLGSMMCCTYNGLIGYYHAWEGIVRCVDDLAQVNLLLNRASPWLEIDSYLPYEGKVVIRNQTAKKLAVRIPRWVNQRIVACHVNGQPARPVWLGQYLLLDHVAPADEIVVTFPMVESVETYTLGWDGVKRPGWTEWSLPPARDWDPPAEPRRYTCHFRGNTLVDISPREEAPGYPLYRREQYRQTPAPMRTLPRYVAPKTIEI